jgi:hypothetical protein
MKKLSSILLAIAMSFYGIVAMTPALALADNGSGHGNGKDNNKTNHGSIVSAVARQNHGKDNENENENENNEGGSRNKATSTAPVITGITAPTVLSVGQVGTWTVNASDPNNGTLSYSVNWGDRPHVLFFMSLAMPAFVQTSTFTHAYSNPGIYTIRFTVENGAGKKTTSTVTVNVVTGPISAAPVISNIAVSNISQTSENVSWNTDMLSDSTVYYGTSTPVVAGALGVTGFNSATMVTNHLINLTGLAASTTYHFFVVSTNSSGQTSTSTESSFTTSITPPPDTTPPNILFATDIGLNASTTRVLWVTNEPSDSKIWVGTTTPVATSTSPTASLGTLSFFHILNIPNLATSTLYFYTVSSTDGSGNTGFYSNSFTTPAI